MASHAMEGESEVSVAGKRSRALVLRIPTGHNTHRQRHYNPLACMQQPRYSFIRDGSFAYSTAPITNWSILILQHFEPAQQSMESFWWGMPRQLHRPCEFIDFLGMIHLEYGKTVLMLYSASCHKSEKVGERS